MNVPLCCLILGVAFLIGWCAAVNPNSPYYTTTVGDFVVTVISDGTTTLRTLEQIAPQAPAPALDIVKDAHGFGDVFTTHFNSLHVDTGVINVVIDTGSGSKLGGNVGKLVENMWKAGLDPKGVDAVIITHAHVDHIAGVMKSDGSEVFPNAKYFIGRLEYEFWKGLTLEDERLKMYKVQESLKPLILDFAKTSLEFIEDNLEQFEFGLELVPGITSKEMVGHSPGHSGFIIRSQNETGVVLGDSLLAAGMQAEHPDWQVPFDMDPMQAVDTRYSILKEFADSGYKIFSYHSSFPGIGRILRGPRGYEFRKANYEF